MNDCNRVWSLLDPVETISSFQFSHSLIPNSLQPYGLQQSRLPCPSPTPGAWSNSCLSSRWCHPTISSSVVPFSSCLQSFPASGSFPMSQFFASGGQSIGTSALASVLPMNIQDWFPLGLTGLISLQSKENSCRILLEGSKFGFHFLIRENCSMYFKSDSSWKCFTWANQHNIW